MTAHAAEASVTASRSGKSQAAFRTISEVADELAALGIVVSGSRR